MKLQAQSFGRRTVGFHRGFDQGRVKDRRMFIVLGALLAVVMCGIIGWKVVNEGPMKFEMQRIAAEQESELQKLASHQQVEMRKLAEDRAAFEATAKSLKDQSDFWGRASHTWFNRYVNEVNRNAQSFDKGFESAKSKERAGDVKGKFDLALEEAKAERDRLAKEVEKARQKLP